MSSMTRSSSSHHSHSHPSSHSPGLFISSPSPILFHICLGPLGTGLELLPLCLQLLLFCLSLLSSCPLSLLLRGQLPLGCAGRDFTLGNHDSCLKVTSTTSGQLLLSLKPRLNGFNDLVAISWECAASGTVTVHWSSSADEHASVAWSLLESTASLSDVDVKILLGGFVLELQVDVKRASFRDSWSSWCGSFDSVQFIFKGKSLLSAAFSSLTLPALPLFELLSISLSLGLLLVSSSLLPWWRCLWSVFSGLSGLFLIKDCLKSGSILLLLLFVGDSLQPASTRITRFAAFLIFSFVSSLLPASIPSSSCWACLLVFVRLAGLTLLCFLALGRPLRPP